MNLIPQRKKNRLFIPRYVDVVIGVFLHFNPLCRVAHITRSGRLPVEAPGERLARPVVLGT